MTGPWVREILTYNDCRRRIEVTLDVIEPWLTAGGPATRRCNRTLLG
jgi:hypothetical protein